MRAETFPYDPVMAASPPSKSSTGHLYRLRLFAVLAVASITLYMLISGTPALFKVGLLEILFGTNVAARSASPASASCLSY